MKLSNHSILKSLCVNTYSVLFLIASNSVDGPLWRRNVLRLMKNKWMENSRTIVIILSAITVRKNYYKFSKSIILSKSWYVKDNDVLEGEVGSQNIKLDQKHFPHPLFWFRTFLWKIGIHFFLRHRKSGTP